ncbi:hypothetical protein EF405_13960 [Cyclobacteriaceae bacterium YHN15]|nr:hypothetical protein EF405_13960 [Cyclobacteriaceae bacterium YHN15]
MIGIDNIENGAKIFSYLIETLLKLRQTIYKKLLILGLKNKGFKVLWSLNFVCQKGEKTQNDFFTSMDLARIKHLFI